MFDLYLKDQHGQPSQLFRPNIENNISKAFDRLVGLCIGLSADGKLNKNEVIFFKEWVAKTSEIEPVWPFPELCDELADIYSNNKREEEQIAKVYQLIKKIIGSETVDDKIMHDSYSSDLPLDTPPPTDIFFNRSQFVLTGRFEFGTRAKVVDKIQELKGIVKDGFPNKETNYLVIGNHVSRDWYYTNYGRKIERAIELREQGCPIAIISESKWRENLDEV